ncbi:MAG: ribonuclease P [Candidatus Diapherotrites archaeon]|nr:ribonuclease P [Candidatus Diapherotrites archaeon]
MNKKIQALALERIYRLFELAELNLENHPKRSKRYIQLARAIGTRTNTRIPAELKPCYCKKCNAFLKEGINAGHGKQGTLLTVKCLECGAERKTEKKPAKGPN